MIRNQVLPQFDAYMGTVFEEIARQHIHGELAKGRYRGDRIGQWWSTDGQHEIDVVGTSNIHDVTLVGSVKWQAAPLDRRVLDALETDLKAIGAPANVQRLLIGRSGMDPSLKGTWALSGLDINDLYRDQA